MVSLVVLALLAGAPVCRKGERCGNTCIAPGKRCALNDTDAQRRHRCTVKRVSDGDSLVCQGGEKVRLLLVDAPELRQAPFGERAKDALVQLAPKGTVLFLEVDLLPKDKYGRTLAYAYLEDGRMVNEELARSGFVVSLTYPPNVRHIERVRAAVADARKAQRGLWSANAFACSPRDFRHGRCR